ncbi:hypothetical protein FSP39_001936 [Pinctada imbricata]|uniref:Reverse transcriptase domain-containing protein n=1 Tax=Pinctada imbricata TaxID=66713 RepID=A0AA88Y6R1_PINIB|nr:hypothetical protein FSP39_001936 [Pinctada imbricata]
MGDFNARSGKKDDFIGLDDNEYTPVDSQYTSDVSRHRNSMDECVNEYGKKLCEFCKNVGLRIMNGRCMGDLKGSFTCYQWNGCSTVDYCIAQEDLLQDLQMFKVHEFKGNLSNHCKISTQLSISAKIKNSRIDTHPLTKVKWTEEMKMKYKIAIQTTQFLEAVESLSTNVEKEDINTLISELSNLLVGILPRNNKSTEKKKRKSKRQKWYDQDCRDMKSSLYKLNRSLIKNPYDKEIREKFFHIRKSYKKLLRYKMKQYKNEIIEKIDTLKSSNAREFWKLVRELKELDTEKKTKINSDIIPPEKWFTHFENLLGSQVKSKDSMENIEYEIEKLKNEPYFNELDFSIKESEIKKAISNLKKGKACGLDNINNEMIKISQDVCLVTYQKIFNKILNTGIFPSKWSKGYITPIHKAGNASDPNNYRGIMINSCLSKVFTSIINDRLYNYLVENNIINDLQIGFMKNSQTTDHMLILKTLIDKYVTNGKQHLYLCFVDFKKAYDTVWRKGLLYKLLKAGIRGKTFNVIDSMYSKSECCIKLNGPRTDFIDNQVGVKQGEVLSPLLFNLFINDLVESIDDNENTKLNEKEVPCLLYADDLVLISTSEDDLQRKLNGLDRYCNKWSLEINTSKTKVMRVTKNGRKSTKSFYLGKKQLDNTDNYKYLGLIFSASGKFKMAKDNISDRGMKALFSLKSAIDREYLSVFTSLKLFDHTVKQVCLYGSEIWSEFEKDTGSLSPYEFIEKWFKKSMIEKVNMSFSKWLLGVHKKTSNLAVMGELGRYPLFIDTIVRTVSYWANLQKRRFKKPLLNDCLKLSENLHNNGSTSWISGINKILQVFGVNYYGIQNSMIDITSLKKNVLFEFEKFWKININNGQGKKGNNKLRTYSKFKTNFVLEKYILETPFSL